MDKSKSSNLKDLLTSTESETFETWTLVTPEIADTNKSKMEGVATAQTSVLEKIDEPVGATKKDDNTDGELSDGISIISDSESAGRASPQPAPRRSSSPIKHITDNLTDNESDNPDASGQSAPITPPITPDTTADITPPSITIRMRQLRADEPAEHQSLPMPGFNYSWLFYLTAFMAVIAFLGRVRLPEWDNTPSPLHSKLDYLIRKMESIGDFQIYLETKLSNQFGQLAQIDHNALYEDYIALLQGDNLSRQNERFVAMSECGAPYLKSKRLPNDQFIFKRCIESQKQLKKIDRSNELPKFSDQIRTNEESIPAVDDPKPIEKTHSEPDNSKKNNNRNQNDSMKRLKDKSADEHNKNHDNINKLYEKEKQKKRERLNKFRDAEIYNERNFENLRAENNDWDPIKLKRGRRESVKPDGDTRKANNNNDNDESDWYEKLMREREDLRKLRDEMQRKHYGDDKNNWYLERSSHRREARKGRNAP